MIRRTVPMIHYKNDHCKVNIYDAYARLSFGVRL